MNGNENDLSDDLSNVINFPKFCNSDFSSCPSPSELQIFGLNSGHFFSPSFNNTPISSPQISKQSQSPSLLYTPFMSLNSIEEIVPILQSLTHKESSNN